MNKYPLCVVIYLTDYCNLKCKHCFLTQTNSLNKNMLNYELLKKLLLSFKKNNVFMIAYTGGDPILHKDFFDILNYTKELGMLPLLGISGVNVTYDECKKIYDSGVRCVQVGLNGSNKELNDKYRGSGSFNKIIKTIDNLKDNGLNVNVAFCLDKNNYKDLNNMLELANKNNAYKVKIEFWNCMNDNDKSIELSENDKDYVCDLCDSYMKSINRPDWIQYPKSKAKLTRIHSNALIIMPNGDVKKHELGEVLGNIYINSIDEIMEEENE